MNLLRLSGCLAAIGAQCVRGLCVIAGALTLTASVLAAPALKISPTTLAVGSSSDVSLHVTGLSTPGQTVLIERYLDVNGDGLIDSGDRLVQSSRVTDGDPGLIGGQRNRAVPTDEDEAVDNQLTMRFSLRTSVELARIAGGYLIRVSSPAATFSTFTQPFAITPGADAQSISGTVTSDGVAAVPNAVVVLLMTGGPGIFFRGAVADANGQYTIGAPAGTYKMIAIAPGFLASLSGAPEVVLAAAMNATKDIAMVAATRTIAGRLENSTNPTTGLPGVQLLVQSGAGLMAMPSTDATGNYSVGVTELASQLEPAILSLTSLGYIGASNVPVEAATVSANGHVARFDQANALIHGIVTNSGGIPLAQVIVHAQAATRGYALETMTDALGRYAFGVRAGDWTLQLEAESSGLAGYTAPSRQVVTVASGQAMKTDFTALGTTSRIIGTVTNNGVPVSGLALSASLKSSSANTSLRTVTDISGKFDLEVLGGTWGLQLENPYAMENSLVGTNLSVTVADRATVLGIVYSVKSATGLISGQVTDHSGIPLANATISASTTIDGVNYGAVTLSNVSGNYAFSAIDGTWNLYASSPALNFASRTVAVSGSATADFAATVFSQPPVNQTVAAGGATGFNVQVNAPGGAAALHWQLSTDGGASWSDVPASAPYAGTATNSLGINPAGAELNGTLYRCVASGSFGTENSSGATLTVSTAAVPPSIAADPVNQTVSLGQNATFNVSASGTPTPAIQWQLSTDDGFSWTNVAGDSTHSGTTTGTLTVATANVAQTGDRYRAIATNSVSSATSAVAILTLSADFNFWRATYFTPAELGNPAVSGPTAIYGADGLPNLVKYALGFEPAVNVTAGLPEVIATATEWIYTYTRPTDCSDLTYEVEISANLTTWATANVTHELVATDDVAGTQTWRARYPLASAANAFFRLKVTQ